MLKLSDLRKGDLLYVATPYTKFAGGIDEAARQAAVAAGHLMAEGHLVFSPITHSHEISKVSGLDPLDPEFWKKIDAPFIEACDALVVVTMDGWDVSNGVIGEIGAFSGAGKPVVYLKPEEVGLC